MSDTPPVPAPRKWLGPALLVSLVVNLFLIGVIASSVWMRHADFERGGPGGPGPLSFLFGDIKGAKSDMTTDDRAALRKMMMGQFKMIRPHLDEIDDARKSLGVAIALTPYDPAKVAESFARMEAAQMSIGSEMRDVMIKGFGEMDDAQRQRLGKIMEQNAERDWRRRKNRGPDDGPPPPPGE
ncbi:MAG: periplasmic heavy metal sensor [Parvibaculum sp.]|nr:periplasmic heavy metal sensor [Parvibaculum sp.]